MAPTFHSASLLRERAQGAQKHKRGEQKGTNIGMLNDAALLAVAQTMTAVADISVIPNIRLTHGQVVHGLVPLGSQMAHLMQGIAGISTMLKPTPTMPMSISIGLTAGHMDMQDQSTIISLYLVRLYRSRGGIAPSEIELHLVRLYRSRGGN